jgi:hypothetical protein
MNRQHSPWALAAVFAFLACVSAGSGPVRTDWEYKVSYTRYSAGPLDEEEKRVFADFYNELGEEGWEYCGNVATRDTLDFQQGWAVNLWKRPR